MDMHNWDRLLSGCSTLVDYRLDVHPLGVGDLLAVWWMPFIKASWRIHRGCSHCAWWRRASSPNWHVATWFPIRRIEYGSGAPGALTMFLWGIVEPVEYIALENRWIPWRLLMEWCGLALCSYTILESLLCTTSPLEHETCTLEWTSHVCRLQELM